ncbi:MAG: hypothetical protein CFH30_00006 [Alphaproteobacteria bacterium MarineAlpha8_Bin1]|nr:MAG: hypothetical protein CFH30_00006 [Alphaproteobacteria bacterium MarineAlpha8_Bin1]|tara:strand:+ start:1219 stop:2109 length:891 start_codon:yes stop_codon:yes gene_type:complete
MNEFVGMIGFGLIAKVHSKILFNSNCPIKYILVKSDQSIKKTKFFFEKEFSYSPKITKDIDFFFSKKIDFLYICSPPKSHFEFLIKAFNNKIPVFCEKPIFWDSKLSLEKFSETIKILESHKNKNFLINTSNAYFLKFLMLNIKEKIKKFKFVFHTNGFSKFEQISEDLLPHGLSLLIEIFGFSKIKEIKKTIVESKVNYKFLYSDASIEFSFREDPSIEKKMVIQLNEHIFTRIQTGEGANYKVSFKTKDGSIIDNLEDPFKIYSKLFFKGYRQHKKDFYNLKLMNQIIKCSNEI